MISTSSRPLVWLRAAVAAILLATVAFTLVASSASAAEPAVGVASNGVGGGWVANANGAITAFGGAQSLGDLSSTHLNQPIVGIGSTPSHQGYWMVASDGGVFAYGDARFYGSTGSIKLNQPVVGMSPTTDGGGYSSSSKCDLGKYSCR